ncbi:MAG: FAD-dependent oxidoreductase [Candidatus Thorarchaeota archaeon]
MILLDNSILKEKYDVIVVGAGIGGITAGALLAKKGLDVLVIEQHYLPGGVCSTVKRQGVAMDAGAALLFGWEENSQTPHRFVMNTLEEEVEMIPHESIYRMHFNNGRSVTFWKDFEKYFKELTLAFPGKDEQFRGFYEHSFGVYKTMTKSPMPMSPDTMPKSVALKMLLKDPINTMKMPKLMNTSLKTVLDKYVQDPIVEGFFDLLIASCYCTTIEETPLMLAAAVVCGTHVGGAYYPAGSPQMLPNKLEKALEKFGGKILYRHLVEEILIKDNKAYGVRLTNGTEILGERIISNASVWQLYSKLIKPENTTPEKIAWAKSFIPSVGACILYIGVEAKAIPEGTQNIEAFINDVQDMTKNNYFVYIPSIDDPSICPEGMHSISILCSAGEEPWPRPGDPKYQSEEYNQRKQQIADKALDVVEKHFPNFRKYIRTMEIATPSTIERFTLKDWGNIGGPKQMLGQHLLNRLKARTEIKNLYAAGDSTSMGEGVVSATASAVGAANMILEDLKQKQFLPEKFDKEYTKLVKGKQRIPLPSKDEILTDEKAQRLAIECQWCEDPVCMKKCPASIDVLNFIRRIESGNYSGAAKAIREMNPLAEICGYVCPAEKLCQSECKHLEFSNEPTRIAKLQSWVSERAGKKGWDLDVPKKNNITIAIIGAGPAGLSSAYYLAKLGYSVEIFEKDNKIGGKISQVIPTFRLPQKTIEQELSTMTSYSGIKINYGKSLGEDINLKELAENYPAVIIATGLDKGRTINIPGLDKVEAIDALSYLKLSRDNQAITKENIIVIGGGSVAVDTAIMAKKNGAKKVSLICLETKEEMPCLESELEDLRAEGIDILNSWGPSEITPGLPAKLSCVSCSSVFDSKGNFCPEYNESKKTEIQFDQIILAIGQMPDPMLVEHFKSVAGGKFSINKEKLLVEGFDNVFIGGDLIRGAGTVVEAVADGRKIAQIIHQKLQN